MDSFPPGLQVALDAAIIGSTPLVVTPPYSNDAHVISIIPKSGAVYRVSLAESGGNSRRSLVYNSLSDISGSAIIDAPAAAQSMLRRGPLKHAAQPIPDELYITTAHDKTSAHVRALEARAGIRFSGEITSRLRGHTYLVRTPAADREGTIARLRQDADTLRIDIPQKRWLSSATAPAAPNDPYYAFAHQWDLFTVSAAAGWTYTAGDPGLSVAVIDSGADAKNADIAHKIVFSESVIHGVVSHGNDAVRDQDGHGTNVAGIVADETNNGVEYASIGNRISLQIYRIFDTSGSGASSADEALAIHDAIANKAAVINLSLGSGELGGPDPVEEAAIEDAIVAGIPVVAASGNESVGTLDYPAAYDGVISVGASALLDGNQAKAPVEYVAGYSNWSPALTIVAPGGDPSSDLDPDPLHWIENIYTTTPSDTANACSDPANCRAQLAGTSQATPHVAAAVGLMKSLSPSLPPSRIATILRTSADDLHDAHQGAGRLNVGRALAAVSGDPVVPHSPAAAVAFAYASPAAGDRPTILDTYFTGGVALDRTGAFRLGDIDPTYRGTYRIGVWIDVNGNGRVDAGDYFGATKTTCSGGSACAVDANVLLEPVTGSVTL